MDKDKYAAQKKYLEKRKNLRVWVDADKYEKFKQILQENDTSIYSAINEYIDDVIAKHDR